MPETMLIKMEEATRLLAECRTIDEAKQYHDLAEAARQYAKMHGLSVDAVNHAVEIKLRAERLMGEMLAQSVNHDGGRPQKNGNYHGTVFSPMPKLTDIGISKNHSSSWQTLAVLPASDFEAQIAETKTQGKELTSAAVYESAKKYRATQHPATQAKPAKSNPHAVFNRTNEMVDWAKWTWNPVTGCLHTCVYCYARDMAEGRTGNAPFKTGFTPTFHPERLAAPHNTKVPASAASDIGERNVFVCSMADLFGKWVAQQWIDAVMNAVRAAPQWNFLFLTKFPQRLESIDWPENAWVGTTVDEQYRVTIAEKAFRNVNAPVKWLSCEPLRERLTFSSLDMFDWVVVGGQSRSSQEPAFQPQWEWVEHLWQQARASGCLLYWKPNLHTRPQEYPQAAVSRL